VADALALLQFYDLLGVKPDASESELKK